MFTPCRAWDNAPCLACSSTMKPGSGEMQVINGAMHNAEPGAAATRQTAEAGSQNSPSISVCIATYNGEKYIYQQLASILKQLKHTDEVIISDDSSTDSTLRIISEFNDARIRIYP